MHKVLFLFFALNLFTCERPAPQKPKVISSITYMDSINYDSIAQANSMKSDTLSINSTTYNLDSTAWKWVNYSNVANRKLEIGYSLKNKHQIKVKFVELGIDKTLTSKDTIYTIYQSENIIWETEKNKYSGKLTVDGKWYDFVKSD